MAAKTKLQAVRLALGYKQDQVIRMLLARARVRNVPVASVPALHTMLSRWENGHDRVTDPVYRTLFRDIYGRSNEELGFPTDEPESTVSELRQRLTIARSIDTRTIELLSRQVDDARHLDRRLGGVALLDQLNSQVDQITGLLTFATLRQHREALAAVLADTATLAGWEALDRGSLLMAWQHHETAKLAAREAGSASLLAYATGQQAFILIDLGDIAGAVELLDSAKSYGAQRTAPLLRCWLAAALGEGLAASDQQDAALRAFDEANSLLPADPNDPDLPFLMLSSAHLGRWRGAALTKLGNQEAITELEHVLPDVLTSSARAATGTLTDLAFAYARKGERDAAISYARRARQVAGRIGSERQKRRLASLLLPPT